MIRQIIKRILKPLFRFFGLEVASIRSKPKIPKVYDDLEKVMGLNRIGIQASYNCALDQCLIRNGFSFAKTGWHPFIEAYRDISAHPRNIRFKGSFLEKYYKTWVPDSSSDAIAGFENAPELLKSIASFTFHAPWMEIRPEERQMMMERIILDENRVAGVPELSAKEGYGLHGPVSEKKGEIELKRLVNVYNSIVTDGYDRKNRDGDITAICIEYNREYRFCVMHGQHRTAAVAALGFETIPINIIKTVHYSEICHWPQVYRGVWSIQQAQRYIEHLFTFDSKGWARKRNLIL